MGSPWPFKKGALMFEALATESLVPTQPDSVQNALADESLFQIQVEFDNLYQDAASLDQADETIINLEHLIATVNQYGVTKSLLAFTNRDRLLSSTFPAIAACESLQQDVSANSDEARAAQEAIGETVKTFIADWFKKAWDVVTSFASKVVDYSKVLYAKVEDGVKWAAGKAFDAAKAAREVIMAHPVASIIAGVAATATIAAAIIAVWGMPLPVSMSALGSWKTSIVDKLKSAGGAIVSVTTAGAKKVGEGFSATKRGVAATLGYTKDGFTRLTSMVKDTFKEGGKVRGIGSWISQNSKKMFDHVKSLTGEVFKAGRAALSWLLHMTTSVWRMVSGPVGSMITMGLRSFKGLFKRGGEESPAGGAEPAAAAA